jgi:DNA repair protein RecN (Recombination protein N)
MLIQLSIRNIALIEALDLNFGSGLTTVTGETGAGKSITFDALGLILGDRANADMIRAGEDDAQVVGVFMVGEGADTIREVIEAAGIAWDPEVLVVRRSLARKGASRVFVNDVPATVQLLNRMGPLLADRVGQHAQITLMSADAQRSIVDAFGDYGPLLTGMEAAWVGWRAANQALVDLETAADERAARVDYLRFQRAEIAALELKSGEYDELEKKIDRSRNAEKLLKSASVAVNALSDGAHNARSLLGQTIESLGRAAVLDDSVEPVLERLRALAESMDDASHDLARWADGLDMDGDIDKLVARHERIRKAMRRFGDDEEGLITKLESLQVEIHALENFEESLAQARAAAAAAKTEAEKAADALDAARSDAARRLFEVVLVTLHELALQRARLEWRRTGDTLHAHGRGESEILFSANPGQPPAPLRKTASGGELSRILLAFKVALAHRQQVATVVFDEVDTGIGGATAEIVGRLLATLGLHSQVICITHQPQVAVYGRLHLHATKVVEGDRTTTALNVLSHETRAQEIARMLGGLDVSDVTVEHARQLLRVAQAHTTGAA